MAGTSRGRGRGRGMGRGTTISPPLRDVLDTTPAASSPPSDIGGIPTPLSHIPLTTPPSTRVPHTVISTSPPSHTGPLHTPPSDTPPLMPHEASPHSSTMNPPTDMASSSYNIRWGRKDEDGRIWIKSAPKLQFYPTYAVRGKISLIFKQKYEGAWTSWTEVPDDAKDGWFAEFKALFKWVPEDDDNIKRCFHSRGSDALKNALNKVRSGEDKGKWIHPDKLEEMWATWKSDKWVEKSFRNKLNRQAQDGLNVHSGGSVDAAEHARRLAVKLNREPTYFELYERLHRPRGKSNDWHNERQQNIAETYQQRVAESQTGEGSSSQQSENSIFLDVVGGKNKKGRIYGLGSQAATVIASSATSSAMHVDGVSPSRVIQMQSTIDALAAQLQQKTVEQEILVKTVEEMKESEQQRMIEQENMKKKMEDWEKLFQTMLRNNNLNPPPPPPPDADN